MESFVSRKQGTTPLNLARAHDAISDIRLGNLCTRSIWIFFGTWVNSCSHLPSCLVLPWSLHLDISRQVWGFITCLLPQVLLRLLRRESHSWFGTFVASMFAWTLFLKVFACSREFDTQRWSSRNQMACSVGDLCLHSKTVGCTLKL